MYIIYNDTKYQCQYRSNRHSVMYSELPEDFPTPVSGEIPLYANDDFHMRTDNAEDYLRQTFEDGVLTLTNIPEPEPIEPDEPEPEPTPDPDSSVWDELDAAYQEGVDSV